MVYELLGIGEKAALSPDYLRAVLGLKSVRSLQKRIEAERERGLVILSSSQSPGGYYRPETPAEIMAFIRTLENRGSKTLAVLDGARALLAEFEGAGDKNA